MNRWWLTVSTTAAVMLFMLGAQAALESQNYVLAILCLLFAFYVPLQAEALREKILSRPKFDLKKFLAVLKHKRPHATHPPDDDS